MNHYTSCLPSGLPPKPNPNSLTWHSRPFKVLQGCVPAYLPTRPLHRPCISRMSYHLFPRSTCKLLLWASVGHCLVHQPSCNPVRDLIYAPRLRPSPPLVREPFLILSASTSPSSAEPWSPHCMHPWILDSHAGISASILRGCCYTHLSPPSKLYIFVYVFKGSYYLCVNTLGSLGQRPWVILPGLLQGTKHRFL